MDRAFEVEKLLFMNNISLTDTEIRVLQSLHLKGCTGSMGSLNLKQRRAVINGLVSKGLLNDKAQVTELGIELSAPYRTLR